MKDIIGYIPLGVEDVSCRVDSEQLVWVGDCVQVGPLPVEEVRIGFPDLIQHPDARPEFRYVSVWNER